MQKERKEGFTLIELLVVVLIISILAAVALPQYQKAVEKSRLVKYKTWIRAIIEAEEFYYLANGEYTGIYSNLDVTLKNVSTITTAGEYLTRFDGGELAIFVPDGDRDYIQIAAGQIVENSGDAVGGLGVAYRHGDALPPTFYCYEHSCHGTPAGSYCKKKMGVPDNAAPVIDNSFCFRYYEIPQDKI